MDKIPEWLLWSAGIFAAAVFLKMFLDLKKDKKNEKLAEGKQKARDARFITRQDPFPVRHDMTSAAPAADAAAIPQPVDDDRSTMGILEGEESDGERRRRASRRSADKSAPPKRGGQDDSTIIIVTQDESPGIFPGTSDSDTRFDMAREAPAADAAAAFKPDGGDFGGAGASGNLPDGPDSAVDGSGDGGGD
jgi:hypothetical protein